MGKWCFVYCLYLHRCIYVYEYVYMLVNGGKQGEYVNVTKFACMMVNIPSITENARFTYAENHARIRDFLSSLFTPIRCDE